jgi:type I restriction enzyme S subunit
VLAAACSGRLTADWREQNPDIEPAEELLKRIQEERIRRYEKECARAKAEGRSKPKAPFCKDELIAELNIPLPWAVTYLGNITNAQGGIQKTPKRQPTKNPYPYLRVANVYRGYLNLDVIEYFEIFDSKELDKWKLKKGDLLVVEGNGSPTEIGRCALWNEEIPNCVHQNHIIRMRPLLNIDSSFLLTYLNAPQGREVMMQLSSSTSGLHTLSVGKLNNIVIPLPPLAEQEEIVRRVEALFQKCDQIEARYQKAKAYTDKLTQAILAKAFRGELVPQDPNDEPAEVLLERIKAEKAATAKPKKTTKKRGKKASSPQQTIPGMEST